MVDTVWTRLKPFFGEGEVKARAVADKLEVTVQAATKLMDGGGLGVENLFAVSKKYGLNPYWLYSGDGEKFAQTSREAAHITPAKPGARYLAARLAELLVPLDTTDRKTAAVILQDMAAQPEDGDRMAGKLAHLLGEPLHEVEEGQRSGTSG